MTITDNEWNALLAHPIPVLSNTLIGEMIERGLIRIEHSEVKKFAASAYQISPHRLRFRNEDADGLGPEEKSVLLDHERRYRLRPGEYAVVSPLEKFIIADGIVADFFPSSWCIENRLLLVAGRLDARYRADADIVFGLYNAGRIDVDVGDNIQIARVSFGWMGLNNIPDYNKNPPGAYYPQLKKLRAHEDALAAAEEDVRKRREEIEKIRKELKA